MEKILNKNEACQFLNCKLATLNKLLAMRKLPVIRFNRRVYFKKEDLEQFIEAHRQAANE